MDAAISQAGMSVFNRFGGVLRLAEIVTTQSMFDEMSTRFDGLSMRFDGLSTRFDGLSTFVGDLSNSVDDLSKRVGGVEKRLGALERTVDGMRGTMATSEEMRRLHHELVRRIDGLARG